MYFFGFFFLQGRIDKLVPDIIQLVLARLQQPIENRDLKVMLLTVSFWIYHKDEYSFSIFFNSNDVIVK